LAPSQPIDIETYEPDGTDPLLAFKRIASAEDALAFANKYGFLGVEEITAAVSAGVMPISEPSFELCPPWMFSGKRNTKAKLPTAQRDASVSLILRHEHRSTRIDSSFDDLRERISIGLADAVFRAVREERDRPKQARFILCIECAMDGQCPRPILRVHK
jgi:hypothetical protein